MTPAVDEDVSHHAVAALAGEAVLAVAFLGRAFIPLHRQVVVGHLQLLVSRLGVQLERLTWQMREKKNDKWIQELIYLELINCYFCLQK